MEAKLSFAFSYSSFGVARTRSADKQTIYNVDVTIEEEQVERRTRIAMIQRQIRWVAKMEIWLCLHKSDQINQDIRLWKTRKTTVNECIQQNSLEF